MTRKIFDWVTIGLTFVLTISALGVVGSFEQDRLDAAGFFIGQAVCIAGIAMLVVVHHLLSKKRKSPRGAATPTKGNSNKNRIYYSKER
ncbi:MAG: hypothetical protein KH011_02145 [Clostridiales bacterium]|nr:hypothetical protein [Clostridiales bacterium]